MKNKILRNRRVKQLTKVNCYTLFLILFSLLITSCKLVKEEELIIPEDLIPQEKMVDILVDFHMAESSLLHFQHKFEDIEYQSAYYYDALLKKHNITNQRFITSMEYYKYSLDEFKKIYEDVITKLNQRHGEVHIE